MFDPVMHLSHVALRLLRLERSHLWVCRCCDVHATSAAATLPCRS